MSHAIIVHFAGAIVLDAVVMQEAEVIAQVRLPKQEARVHR